VQLVQLQHAKSELESLGYGVAAISYDSPELLEEFARRKKIDFPLIADPQSEWLASAGLMNQEATGMLKGTSLPATLVIQPDGLIKAVYRESAYQDRLTPASLVEILKGGQAPEAAQSVLPDEPVVTLHQTDFDVSAGSLFTLWVEVALPRGTHAYAPEASGGVVPTSLTFEPHPYLEAVGVEYPQSRIEDLLGESVPVYEGRITVRAQIKVRSDKDSRAKLAELAKLPLKAKFKFQCCTDTTCLAPQIKQVEWKFNYLPLDVQRSPDSLKHQ
jgi:hypothetical protein